MGQGLNLPNLVCHIDGVAVEEHNLKHLAIGDYITLSRKMGKISACIVPRVSRAFPLEPTRPFRFGEVFH